MIEVLNSVLKSSVRNTFRDCVHIIMMIQQTRKNEFEGSNCLRVGKKLVCKKCDNEIMDTKQQGTNMKQRHRMKVMTKRLQFLGQRELA